MSRRHLSEIELTEYADGEMSPARAGWMEAHLRRCDACAEALAESRRAAALVGRLRPVAVPAALRQRISLALAREAEKTLSCRQMVPLLHAYLDRCLCPVLAEPVRGHLERCAHCRQEFGLLTRATRLVRALPAASVPVEVRERVAAARRLRLPGSAWGVPMRPALAAAGLVALGALALLFRPGLSPGPREPLAAPSTRAAVPPVTSAATAASTPTTVADAREVQEVTPELAAPSYQSAARAVSRTALKAARLVKAVGRPSREKVAARATLIAAAPDALQALKSVARSAEYAQEARRAMDLAAESFATLSSEEMLDRLPESAGFGTSTGAAPPSATTPPPTAPPAGLKTPGADSALAPGSAHLLAPGPVA